MRKMYFSLIALLLISATALAQRTVSGKVTDETGEGLPGVNVVIKGTTTGVTTDLDGNFQISVPDDNTVLVFSSVGMETQEVTVGTQTVLDVAMAVDTRELQEVVVTGVSESISTNKLGFAIGKVNEDLLSSTPAMDAGNALRGKVAGVQIVQPSGVPGTAGSINLRGATTLSGSNSEPLIIIDGIITPPGSAGLRDINMNDVQSIEVIKGAAGASLYGSLAGNGVIQIITKRGSQDYGKTRITFRTEYGSNEQLRKINLSKSHAFLLNPDGSYALDINGQRINDPEQIFDNPYPRVIDQQEVVFPGRNFQNQFLSLASTTEKTNFYASFDNLRNEGLVPGQQAFERQGIRLNVDHNLNDRLDVGISFSYISTDGTTPQEGGQTGFIYGTLLAEPDQDLKAPNPDGQPYNTRPRDIGNFTNANNPLYISHFNQRFYNQDRVLLGNKAKYTITDWWSAEAQISFDKSIYNETRQQDKNFLSQSSAPTGTGGSIDKRVASNEARVYTLSSNFNRTFGDFKTGLTLRYVGEEYTSDFQQTLGTNLQAQGIFQLDNLNRTTLVSTSNLEIFRADNYMANLRVDYRDKLIFDGLYRLDRSSLFGADVRDQNFYRASLAYRLTEDFKINGIQEWKVRASVGSSGVRPPFEAQYETFSISGGNLVLDVLGNSELKPSIITETEIGTNISFLDRFKLEANYAQSDVEDAILVVPLPGTAGFKEQYQNAGAMRSNTVEIALSADIIKRNDLNWNAGFTYSRSRTKITRLDRPEYFLNAFNGTPMFKIAEGEQLGGIFGNLMASNVNQLTTDNSGFVNNLVGLPNGTYTPEDFEVNDEGYLILTGTQYTTNEVAYHLADATGSRLNTKLGDTNPDALLGFVSSVDYKGFNLFVSMDAQIGGDIANVMRQNLLFNGRSAEVDQSSRPEGQRHYDNYIQSTSNSGNGLNQRYVESAEYVALRELSLSYTFGKALLEDIGFGLFEDIRLSLIGRNLFMITNYSGFTPDISSVGSVAAGNVDQDVLLNPTVFRADAYGYPMFRSFSASVQLRF